ncbi:MAG: hypothetical protein AseanaTS_03680 [Candidatus Pelagadaptatus aseana]|uniref:hypothetical protein n=1 Tax=Candidatus Pelagadaptatus aseana TaxID=3120508 RepID=UPI0039B270AE
MNKILTAMFIIFTVSGCAVFDGGNVQKTTLSPYENNGEAKPNLSYSSVAKGGLSTSKRLSEAGQSIIEGELLSVLQSSDYFGRISRNDESADITIDVTVTNSGNPAALIPAFITGLSLYTIPSWAKDNFNLVANVERKDGLKKTYELTDSATLVQWLPMIFAFPANNFSVVPEVRKNMYKKVLSDMKNDGFFSYKESTLSLAR